MSEILRFGEVALGFVEVVSVYQSRCTLCGWKQYANGESEARVALENHLMNGMGGGHSIRKDVLDTSFVRRSNES